MNSTIEFIGKKFGVDVSTPIVRLTKINRTIIAQLFAELGFKEGAEIGVAEGHYSKVLFDNIPGLTLHLIDIYKSYPGYSELQDPENVYHEAQKRLNSYKTVFLRKFIIASVQNFPDNSLDFVFIDGAHDFKNVACDISEWSKKVKPGGIVYGHDYKYHQAFMQRYRNRPPKLRFTVEVKIVVDAYRDAKRIRPWFEVYPEIRDPTFGPDNPCWMFARQEGDKLWE